MFQKTREFLGQRFAAGGAVDFWLYALLGLSIIASSVLTTANFADTASLLLVLTANVVAVCAIFVLILLFDWFLKSRVEDVGFTLGSLVLAGILVGGLKGLLTWLMLDWLGFVDDGISGPWSRIIFSALTGLIVVPAVALFGSLRYRYAEQREALISEKVVSEGGENYPETLVRFVEGAKQKLAQSKKVLGPEGLAAELREIVNSDLRPLSQEIWVRESRKFPSFRLSQIAKVAIGKHVYASSWVIPIWALTTLIATIRVFSLQEGLLIQVFRALILFLGLFIASKFKMKTFKGALTVYVVAMTLIAFGQVAFGTALSGGRSFGDDVGFMVANLLWLSQLTLIVGMGKAFLEMGKRVENEFTAFLNEKDIAELRYSRELMLRDRQLAQFLHGYMQTRLNGVANRLETRQSKGEINDDLDLVEQVLNDALAEFGKEQTKTLVEAIEAIERDWGGVVQLNFALEPVLLDQSQVQVVREVINEAVANAVRHGFASRVTIVLNEGPLLEITDDGTGPRDGKPGLGTTYFESVSTNWELTATESGARLRLSLANSSLKSQ
jgi:signal transduction histidine kinase